VDKELLKAAKQAVSGVTFAPLWY